MECAFGFQATLVPDRQASSTDKAVVTLEEDGSEDDTPLEEDLVGFKWDALETETKGSTPDPLDEFPSVPDFPAEPRREEDGISKDSVDKANGLEVFSSRRGSATQRLSMSQGAARSPRAPLSPKPPNSPGDLSMRAPGQDGHDDMDGCGPLPGDWGTWRSNSSAGFDLDDLE